MARRRVGGTDHAEMRVGCSSRVYHIAIAKHCQNFSDRKEKIFSLVMSIKEGSAMASNAPESTRSTAMSTNFFEAAWALLNRIQHLRPRSKYQESSYISNTPHIMMLIASRPSFRQTGKFDARRGSRDAQR